MVEAVTRPNLRNHLVSHIFNAVLHGKLEPGSRIIEGKLARQLGVAQGTLREALQELEHQGLVRRVERRGTFVTKLSLKDVEDIYVVRLALEPLAASLARPRIGPEDLKHLADLLNQMRKAAEERAFVQLLKTDLDFHQSIWKLSDNEPLERALNAVCPPLFASYMIQLYSGHLYDFEKDHQDHAALIAILEKGRAEEVYETFRTVLSVFRTRELQNLPMEGSPPPQESVEGPPLQPE